MGLMMVAVARVGAGLTVANDRLSCATCKEGLIYFCCSEKVIKCAIFYNIHSFEVGKLWMDKSKKILRHIKKMKTLEGVALLPHILHNSISYWVRAPE